MLLAALGVPILVLLAAGKSAPVSKHNNTPPHGLVYGAKDLSRIYFTCRFLAGRGEITMSVTNALRCEFAQVFFLMPSAEEAKQKLGKADENFEVTWKETFSKKPLTELKQLHGCGKPEEKQFFESEKRRYESHPHAAALLPALERSLRAYDRLCSCGDTTCFHDALKSQSHQEAQDNVESCDIHATDWKTDFRRTGEAWVSVETTKVCYSSVTTTLSRSKDWDAWDLRTVRVPSPNKDSTFCPKTLQDDTDSPRGYGIIALTCRNLKL